jgi:shikimate dehydrogenase
MRLFGLIGFPLTHSFSKKFFTEKFEKEKMADCRYENFQIPAIESLGQVLSDHRELEGLNVTIPYKESVIRFLSGASDVVKSIGACNCIKIHQKKLYGFNTDVAGFRETFIKKLKPHHTHALILGTGGSAKAVAYVLAQLNISFNYVSRKPVADNFSYEMLNEKIIRQHGVIINTTPVGMYPQIAAAPGIPYNGITDAHYLFDLTYNPEKTLFLQRGEERGATIQNGSEMLTVQAEESWKIWNDPSAC